MWKRIEEVRERRIKNVEDREDEQEIGKEKERQTEAEDRQTCRQNRPEQTDGGEGGE